MTHVALRSLRSAARSVRHVRALHASSARGDSGPSAAAEPAAESAASSSAGASSSASASASKPAAAASSSTPAKGKASEKQQQQRKRAAAISPLDLDISSFPSLLHTAHPVLDAVEVYRRAPTAAAPYPTTLTMVNSEKLFEATPPSAASLALSGGGGGGDAVEPDTYLPTVTPLSRADVQGLHRHVLCINRCVQMSGKGKNESMRAVVVAGNGRGLVGVGEGKDANAGGAVKKAFQNAVKNFDYVERFEGRTIATTVKGKFSSSTVTMRPRPPGFGLRAPPSIHALARSAGIADLSASIEGSTNETNVLKCAMGMLCGGAAPLGLGDGFGGPGRRADKGAGMRSIREIEWARGKRIRETQRL